MKVVHVATAFPRHDDDVVTPWLGQLVIAQREAGLDARVMAPAYRGGGADLWRGVPVRRFRYAPRRLETLTHDETVPDRLTSRPAYGALLPGYMGGGSLAAIRAGLAHPDIVHVHWPVPHAWFGAVARAFGGSGTALVSSFYSVELHWVRQRLPALTPFLRWTIESADAVTAISTSTASAVRRIADRDVRVIPFAAAVETAEGDAPETPSASATGGPFTILFVGRLVERKGVEVLVQALSLLPAGLDVRLVVVGEGPRAGAIRSAAERAGVSELVELTGRVGDDRLREAYTRADLFVLPAIVDAKGDTEGLGVVLLEALRSGLPVVASDAGGIPDIVRDGETGWLVPPGDARALALAIAEVQADPAEASRRVDSGRQLTEERFSLPGIVEALSACYEDALLRRAGRG